MAGGILSAGAKVAVIGSGAAALGVLAALCDGPARARITLIDIGKPVEVPSVDPKWDSAEVHEFYDQVYRTIHLRNGRQFPPPKTHFGDLIARQTVERKLRLFKSETFGGLTNYWGGTMLPFTGREMSGWPIPLETLEPHYRAVADIVGVSGRDDALLSYFGRDFHNRPAIRPTPLLGRLDESVNGAGTPTSFRVVSGVNRCALETREDRGDSCTYCGECMAGCYRDAVYSTRRGIGSYLRDGRVAARISGRVHRIHENGRTIEVETQEGMVSETGFDRIFLCAGCLGTSEILMRSAGLSGELKMRDNAVYVFPIVYLGRQPAASGLRSQVSLCNLILGCIPTDDSHFAQVQVYPDFDYLWRYNVPPRLWPFTRAAFGSLGRRVVWGRLYVHSDHSQSYSLRMEGDRLRLALAGEPRRDRHVDALLDTLRTTLSRNGFWMPRVRPVRQRTNSHYAATLPYGNHDLPVDSRGGVFPNVFIADSTVFPNAPAVSPTFTIMANARRTAAEAMQT